MVWLIEFFNAHPRIEITAGITIIPISWLLLWAGNSIPSGVISIILYLLMPVFLLVVLVVALLKHRRRFLKGMLGFYLLNIGLFVILAINYCPFAVARGVSALIALPFWIWGEYLCY